jgi:hypothetical protein
MAYDGTYGAYAATGNSLERLSGEHIAPLTNLTYLNLHNNPKLRRLPSEMGLYDSLTFLDVTQCMLVAPSPVVVYADVC